MTAAFIAFDLLCMSHLPKNNPRGGGDSFTGWVLLRTRLLQPVHEYVSFVARPDEGRLAAT